MNAAGGRGRQRQTPLGVLAYPLHSAALMVNAILTLARIGASMIPLLGYGLHFFIWLGLYRYAFEVLLATANGRTTPPEVPGLLDESVALRHVWLQATLLLGIVTLSRFFGPGSATMVAVFIGAILPGAALTVAVTQSFIAAINPISWLRVVGQLGLSYAPLAAGGIALTLLQAHAAQFIPNGDLRLLGVVVFYFALHSLFIAYFHGLGTALLAHAKALDFAPELKGLPPHRLRTDEDAVLAAADRRLAEGDAKGARAWLKEAIAVGAGVPIQRRYRELLKSAGEHATLLEHARVFVGQLLALNDERGAIALTSESLAADPRFLPGDPVDRARLIDAALRMSLYGVASALAENILAAKPGHSDSEALAMRVLETLHAANTHPAEVGRLHAALSARVADGETHERLREIARKLPA